MLNFKIGIEKIYRSYIIYIEYNYIKVFLLIIKLFCKFLKPRRNEELMKVVLKNLTKKFPGAGRNKNDSVIAVNNFNFEIPDGKLVGLLGPSGCGKSTALNMICGLLKPTEGKIFFGDEDVTNTEPEDRGVGMVFQNYALYPHLNVRQNILFPLQNFKGKDKLSKEEMLKRTDEAARLVQIESLMDRKPSELSGGQQQRVAIARALVKRPKVLLLDEPLSNLDARLRLQTREKIRNIQTATGITTIFVTHDQEEAMSICDVIVVMNHGIIQQIGKPQEVYDNPLNLFVAKFLGTPPVNVFKGKIRNGSLYIGEANVLGGISMPDRDVYIGIRPEGFLADKDGPLECSLERIQIMGRDVTVVASHKEAVDTVRAVMASDNDLLGEKSDKYIRFSIKPKKVYLFDRKSEERLKF